VKKHSPFGCLRHAECRHRAVRLRDKRNVRQRAEKMARRVNR
jgi:hypothetical protein